MKLHTALTIAGTDPSGGAGIMADLKSFQSRHVYGMAVVTSVAVSYTHLLMWRFLLHHNLVFCRPHLKV